MTWKHLITFSQPNLHRIKSKPKSVKHQKLQIWPSTIISWDDVSTLKPLIWQILWPWPPFLFDNKTILMGTRQFFSFATKTTRLRNRTSVSRFFFKSRSLNGVATTNKFIMQKTKNLWPEHIVAVLLRNAIKSLTLWHLAYTVPKEIDFPRYDMKCSGENMILRGIFHEVSLHFMLYSGNLDTW